MHIIHLMCASSQVGRARDVLSKQTCHPTQSQGPGVHPHPPAGVFSKVMAPLEAGVKPLSRSSCWTSRLLRSSPLAWALGGWTCGWQWVGQGGAPSVRVHPGLQASQLQNGLGCSGLLCPHRGSLCQIMDTAQAVRLPTTHMLGHNRKLAVHAVVGVRGVAREDQRIVAVNLLHGYLGWGAYCQFLCWP